MNNKGFTLIELLAVVILLITISLFVMPRIVDVIKDGDKTKEDIAKNKIIESAKEYASNYDTNFLNDLVNVGDTKSISKEDLLNSKLIDVKDIENISFVKVKVILKEDNKLEYTLSDIAIETTYLTINLDGGTGENKSGEYGVGTTITLNTPSKEGYAFSHWQVVSGNSILSGNILTIGTTSTTIKAVWIKKVIITLDLDGGSINQTLNSNYTAGLTITLETPTKSSFTFAGWKIVSGDSAISGNSLTVGTLDTTIKANWIANNYDFAYTGDVQTFTAQKTGKYKLEVWGASGGGTGENVSAGYGGYSTGQITLNKGEVIYIVIGGEGGTTQAPASQVNGGYNGGGSGFSADKYGVNNYGSGGGATHIAKVSGTLSELSNNISSILIVAGGGGGSAYYKNGTEYYHYGSGGSGGGYKGVNSYNYYSSTQVVKTALGGSQTLINSNENIITNGSFGTGANGTEASGGGGGFYGGQTAHLIGSAGGSGYIGNSLLTNKVMYCYNCTASSEESTKTISTTCTNGSATENCAKKGNGYAKITYIGE